MRYMFGVSLVSIAVLAGCASSSDQRYGYNTQDNYLATYDCNGVAEAEATARAKEAHKIYEQQFHGKFLAIKAEGARLKTQDLAQAQEELKAHNASVQAFNSDVRSATGATGCRYEGVMKL